MDIAPKHGSQMPQMPSKSTDTDATDKTKLIKLVNLKNEKAEISLRLLIVIGLKEDIINRIQ